MAPFGRTRHEPAHISVQNPCSSFARCSPHTKKPRPVFARTGLSRILQVSGNRPCNAEQCHFYTTGSVVAMLLMGCPRFARFPNPKARYTPRALCPKGISERPTAARRAEGKRRPRNPNSFLRSKEAGTSQGREWLGESGWPPISGRRRYTGFKQSWPYAARSLPRSGGRGRGKRRCA